MRSGNSGRQVFFVLNSASSNMSMTILCSGLFLMMLVSDFESLPAWEGAWDSLGFQWQSPGRNFSYRAGGKVLSDLVAARLIKEN